MDRQNKIGPIDRLSQEREYYMAKNCEQLYIYLNRNSGKMNDNDQLFLLRVMIEEKHCEDQRLVPFLEKLLESKDDYYRYLALDLIVKIDFIEKRNILVSKFTGDPDETVRNYALIKLSTNFRNQRDKEILELALGVYDDPNSSVATRLVAGAAMMYQLGISHDEHGRPAWYEENEEELHHPRILEAVYVTRQFLAGEE